jgi:hypothetical protein
MKAVMAAETDRWKKAMLLSLVLEAWWDTVGIEHRRSRDSQVRQVELLCLSSNSNCLNNKRMVLQEGGQAGNNNSSNWLLGGPAAVEVLPRGRGVVLRLDIPNSNKAELSVARYACSFSYTRLLLLADWFYSMSHLLLYTILLNLCYRSQLVQVVLQWDLPYRPTVGPTGLLAAVAAAATARRVLASLELLNHLLLAVVWWLL